MLELNPEPQKKNADSAVTEHQTYHKAESILFCLAGRQQPRTEEMGSAESKEPDSQPRLV